MLIFVEGGKLEKPDKNSQSKVRINSKLKPNVVPGWNLVSALTTVPSLLSKLWLSADVFLKLWFWDNKIWTKVFVALC